MISKGMKELCVVLLIGAGLLTIIWGLSHQVDVSPFPSNPDMVHEIAWVPVFVGGALVIISVAIALFMPSKKTRG
ncbi:MAG: hypothetical protein FWH42_06125 [Dehalococcoidia bacterium]|nr:hypothetical protein [Dehalococcoidia bacterium]